MNTERPHEIVRGPINFPPQSNPMNALAQERKWLPITDEEADFLGRMSEDQRAFWFAELPFTEKLRRWSVAEDRQ